MATFRSTDTYPKEIFVHHAAGFGGYGGSSYIDAVVCRDRDESSGWTSAADATPESRRYIGQSWRADVNVVWDSTGHVVEWMRYTPYGEAVTLPWINADFNRSGGTPDGGDYSAFTTAYTAHSASADMDRSGGTPDSADFTAYDDAWNNGDAPLDGYVGGTPASPSDTRGTGGTRPSRATTSGAGSTGPTLDDGHQETRSDIAADYVCISMSTEPHCEGPIRLA